MNYFARFWGVNKKKIQYKTVNIGTMQGIKQAEKLKDNGWQVGNFGFNTIQFYKRVQK